MKGLAGLTAPLLLATGCAGNVEIERSVKDRAAFDLACPAESLEVVDLPGASFGVRGCGRRAAYVFEGPACRAPKQLTRKEFSAACTPKLDYSAPDADGGGDLDPVAGVSGSGENDVAEPERTPDPEGAPAAAPTDETPPDNSEPPAQ